MLSSDPKLRARVCTALLRHVGLEHFWTRDGPSEDGKKLYSRFGGPISTERWVIFQVAWLIWSGTSKEKVEELNRFEHPNCDLVSSLLRAISDGESEVNAWLSRVDWRA